jgi:hypothetical protein
VERQFAQLSSSTGGHSMGAKVVADVRWGSGSPTNGGTRMRAPASARRPRGTGLGG